MEWVTELPRDRPVLAWGIGPDTGFPVMPEVEAKATAALKDNPAIRLTADEFQAYTGRKMPNMDSPYAFLIRYVTVEGYPDTTDRHWIGHIRYSHGIVWAPYMYDPSRQLRKRPIVVLLREDRIDRLFISLIVPI